VPPKRPGILSELRKLLSPSMMAQVGREVAAETVAPRRAAERLGVRPAYERTEAMLEQPSVDSLMALSGGARPGVFYPQTKYAGEVLTAAQKGGATPRQLKQVADMMAQSTQGFYNPVTKRVSFPASVPMGEERGVAIPVAAAKYREEREGGAAGVQERRIDAIRAATSGRPMSQAEYDVSPLASARQAYKVDANPARAASSYVDAFTTAYNFLTESARNPKVSMRDVEALGREVPDATRIAKQLLQEDLFAQHPLARRP